MRRSAGAMAFLTRPISFRGNFLLAVLASLASLWLACGPARAQLKLCNQTSSVVYAAVGIQQSTQITTRGWTRTIPGVCASIVNEPLSAAAYFVYARSALSRTTQFRSWSGQFRLCTRDENFGLQMPLGAAACNADGAIMTPFANVATGGAKAWTMTLTDTPVLATPADARAAGMKRLLAGLGYLAAADNDAKHLNDALAKFRSRAKLAANATPAEIFTALEAATNDQQKSSGYAICNDGNAEVWAALAYWSGKEFVSRGWWDIAAGSCTTPLAQEVSHDPVYLYVSKQGNNHLVTGVADFCISNASFDIHGRDRCEAHGYASKGFEATNIKGASGFVAHIGDNGLVPRF
jgi:uncharacterized membrane protein